MAEHEEYAYRHLAGCACMGAAVYRLMGESAYVVSHEAEQVTYECAECGDVVGVFYRVPELERERVKADKALIGQVIKADRPVAWVGYAKNPSTVEISENDLEQRIKADIAGLVNKALATIATGGTLITGGPPVVTFTLAQADWFLHKANWRVRRGFEQWARYRLRGEAYRKDPLRDRGLWFQDVPVEGKVVSIVRCVTGTQVPGYGGGGWDDYGESTHLSSPVHHSLYGIVTAEGLRRLVHPADMGAHEQIAEGSVEKQFRVEEVVAARYSYAGKLGPWARSWPRDVRYLATGPQKQPVYRRIKQAGKEGGSWRYVRVRLDGEADVRSCWCGMNTYEEVNQDESSD